MSLHVVGLGLMCPQHVTRRTWRALREADQLFFISDNIDKQTWLRQLNPRFHDLMVHYGPDKPRRQTYQDMADQVLGTLRAGQTAALVSYGHPLVFCDPSRLAIEQTLAEGYPLHILPGISSMDCLIADLRVDTQNYGVQVYEAADVLLHGLEIVPGCSQIIFQVPSLGDNTGGWKPGRFRGFVRVLAECLAEAGYGWDHEVVFYRGANSPGQRNDIQTVRLAELHAAPMLAEYTLWVPPLGFQRLEPDPGGERAPVHLELVSEGIDPDDVTREVEELLGEPRAAELDWDRPCTVRFAAHPCSAGAVELAREASRRGLTYRIRPGISWEDQAYCDVPLDPGLGGFQTFLPGEVPVQRLALSTLAWLPSDLKHEDARYWCPGQPLAAERQEESRALFVQVPQPRPIHNEPFLRAVKLSAVERLVAFLETLPADTVAGLKSAPTSQMWLVMQVSGASQRLRKALESTDLGTQNGGDWTTYLLQNPQLPAARDLLLQIRCQDALEGVREGLSDVPLKEWLRGR